MDKFPDRSQIDELQLRKVRSLVETILPANPFYARKLASLDWHTVSASLDAFRAQVPCTSRHELVRDRLEHPPYGSDLTYPLDQYTRCHQTSGSTTVPIRWLDTRESWDHIVGNWLQIFSAAGVTREDRFFFAFSFGPFIGFWSALDAVLRLGCFCFPGGSMNSLARLQAIIDNGITVLCCYPDLRAAPGRGCARKGRGPDAQPAASHHCCGRERREHPGHAATHRELVAGRDGVRSSWDDRSGSGIVPMPRQARHAAYP